MEKLTTKHYLQINISISHKLSLSITLIGTFYIYKLNHAHDKITSYIFHVTQTHKMMLKLTMITTLMWQCFHDILYIRVIISKYPMRNVILTTLTYNHKDITKALFLCFNICVIPLKCHAETLFLKTLTLTHDITSHFFNFFE